MTSHHGWTTSFMMIQKLWWSLEHGFVSNDIIPNENSNVNLETFSLSLSPGWEEEQSGLPSQDEVPGCRATAFRRDLQNPDDEGREVLPQQSLKVNVQQMLRMATADQHRHRQLQVPGVERGQERMQTESESAGSVEGAPKDSKTMKGHSCKLYIHNRDCVLR